MSYSAQSMGMEVELDALCFGKVLRLMAADVARWHQLSGGGLDPNTFVWSELPLPWEVLSGDATCTRQQVEEVCRRPDRRDRFHRCIIAFEADFEAHAVFILD